MKNIKVSRSVIPNTFTSLNLFAGFSSIIMASKGDFKTAAVLIGIAAVCDALDGIMARLTKSASEFGIELDSLADVVSFGAAPSYLIYSVFLNELDIFGIIISSFPLIFGAFRLARFNVQITGFSKTEFIGLPIPFSAITLASFVYLYHDKFLGIYEPYNYFLISLTMLVSVLMVSNVKYDTLPKFTLKDFKRKSFIYYLITVGIVTMIITTGKALVVLLVFYLFIGIIRHIINSFNQKKTKEVNSI